MTEKEKGAAGLLYDANGDPQLLQERARCKQLCAAYDALPPDDMAGRMRLLGQLLGSMGERCLIEQPFWCDYGYNIHVGEDFYMNVGCVILDGAPVRFGDRVFVGPQCGFYTAGHPLQVPERAAGLEYAHPITVGDDVWIGGHVTVLPGVHIGDGAVIGAGSVVTQDIPPHVVAMGVPCRVHRQLP